MPAMAEPLTPRNPASGEGPQPSRTIKTEARAYGPARATRAGPVGCCPAKVHRACTNGVHQRNSAGNADGPTPFQGPARGREEVPDYLVVKETVADCTLPLDSVAWTIRV